jgi:hypothetical protein
MKTAEMEFFTNVAECILKKMIGESWFPGLTLKTDWQIRYRTRLLYMLQIYVPICGFPRLANITHFSGA